MPPSRLKLTPVVDYESNSQLELESVEKFVDLVLLCLPAVKLPFHQPSRFRLHVQQHERLDIAANWLTLETSKTTLHEEIDQISTEDLECPLTEESPSIEPFLSDNSVSLSDKFMECFSSLEDSI